MPQLFLVHTAAIHKGMDGQADLTRQMHIDIPRRYVLPYSKHNIRITVIAKIRKKVTEKRHLILQHNYALQAYPFLTMIHYFEPPNAWKFVHRQYLGYF